MHTIPWYSPAFSELFQNKKKLGKRKKDPLEQEAGRWSMVVQVSFQFRNKCKAFQRFWWLLDWSPESFCSSSDVSVPEGWWGAEGAAPQETAAQVLPPQIPSCRSLFAYFKASRAPLRMRNICSETVPYCPRSHKQEAVWPQQAVLLWCPAPPGLWIP